MSRDRLDFFISYTSVDEDWASWIGWVLEEEGALKVKLQAWDFAPGSNFVLEMHRAASEASRTLAVLSPAYLKSTFAAPEWAAAFASDPDGLKRTLVPVRVRECEPAGLLKSTVYVDLVGLNEKEARERLLDRLSGRRGKPSSKPRFPSEGRVNAAGAPHFPAGSGGSSHVDHYVPKLNRAVSDLDKRRFLHKAFDCIVQHFDRSLKELVGRHEGVEYELRPITSIKYIAEIFVHGTSRARCKFWIADRLGSGIAYSETDFGWDSDSSYNEMLSLADDGLALRTLMGMGWGSEEKGLGVNHLGPEEAAEYLWRRFTSHLDGR